MRFLLTFDVHKLHIDEPLTLRAVAKALIADNWHPSQIAVEAVGDPTIPRTDIIVAQHLMNWIKAR